MTADEVCEDALKVLGTYHTHTVVEKLGNGLRVGSMKLVYYYANRTSHIPSEADS